MIDIGRHSTVTVVIPFKDRIDLLRKTISSLQNQSLETWAAILIDDGSQPESVRVVRELSDADGRLLVLAREGDRRGPSACRNQGAAVASTPLLMFLDSDDLLLPDALARGVETMARNLDTDFCIFSSLAFSDDENTTTQWTTDWTGSSDLDRLLAREWPLNVSSIVWRTDYFNRYGKFDQDLPSWEDWDLHVRVLAEKPKYLRFNEPNVLIRTAQTHARLSSVQYKNSKHLDAASNLFPRIADFLQVRGLLSEKRSAALCELVFGNAYLSLLQDGSRIAMDRYERGQGCLSTNALYARNRNRLRWCILKQRLGLI